MPKPASIPWRQWNPIIYEKDILSTNGLGTRLVVF